MKNFINYYYNFNIYNIVYNNGKYFFRVGNENYMLKVCDNCNNLQYYEDLKYQFLPYKYIFTIIPNRDNSYITFIENKPYVLMKLSNIKNDKISIFDIKTDMYINLSGKLFRLNNFEWIRLWESKIDYFEEWFNNKQDSYKNIFPLFHYFIGVAENALLYLKESEKEENKEESDKLVISHTRIGINYKLYDYYDPINMIIDHASRDVGEYVKSMFINRIWDLEILKNYLNKHKFSRYGIRILLARVLFPSFFFDYIEEMITKNQNIDILYLENRVEEFEKFIKQIIIYFNEKYNIPTISWIIKKT